MNKLGAVFGEREFTVGVDLADLQSQSFVEKLLLVPELGQLMPLSIRVEVVEGLNVADISRCVPAKKRVVTSRKRPQFEVEQLFKVESRLEVQQASSDPTGS